MKNRISLVLSIGLIVPLLIAGVALAVDEPQNQTTAQTTETKPQASTKTAEQKAKQKARFEKRIAELKIKLSAFQEKRIKDRCKNSQTIAAKVVIRLTNIEANRGQKYTRIADRLSKLEAKLDAKNFDTAVLKAQVAELQAKIAVFNTDWALYKEAVTDLAEVDCVADPSAFKASLEATRTALKKVRADASDIKSYIKTTIKPTLQSLRTQVEQQSTNGGTN